MHAEIIFSFVLASVILSLMPGPDNIYVLTESISKGHRNGIAISAGLSSGVLVHTILATTGLSIILQQSALAFTLVKFVGAAYLLYLAWKSYREKELPVKHSRLTPEQSSYGKLMVKGFLMNVLNPKVSLFFIAFLPQFISHTGVSVSIQMLLLGTVFMVQAFVVFSIIALLSGRLSQFLQGANFWKTTKWVKVSVLTILAVSLVLSKK